MNRNSPLLFATILLMSSCGLSTKTHFKSVDIQLIRNATLKLNYNGKTILVDPSLSPKNSFMSFVTPNKNLNPTVELSLPIKEIADGLDFILVTHTHLDHFDEGAKTHLDSNLPLFGQPFDKDFLEKSPFKNVSIIEDHIAYEGTTIIRTDGKHGPEHLLKDLGEVSGFVLQAKNFPTIYIVGDCLWDDDIKANIKKYRPDIIVINSGGALFGEDKILMDEKKAVEVAKFALNSKIIAVHMESLDHCTTTRQMVLDEAKKENVLILVPKDGEIINL